MSIIGFFHLNSSDTKAEVIRKYNELHDNVVKHLSDLERSSVGEQLKLEHEILDLYRSIYKNDETKTELLNDYQYRLYCIESIISNLKDDLMKLM